MEPMAACMLPPMLDPDAGTSGPPYLPFAAYAPPSRLAAPAPSWTRAYELPSARKVVSAGLQLALGSNVAIRRASIYIGLLSLGAFGPAAILLLIGLARLLNDPATARTLTGGDPTLIFFEQPELAGPLTLLYVVGIVGIILLIAISIDAEAIAISLLGSSASESPLRLSEALTRARQTFWRLFWSGLVVGLTSAFISFVIALPFLRPFDTNQGITFIASMVATLVVSPFAFAATGIVLGDAGAIETLRRSVQLFRARPRIGLVVTLFTLVTSAIQTLAFSAGADIAFRVADFFHLGGGGAALILPGILVLAFIVAFGSLTFTIAAIVAAPQVSAFLGLTFYSAGLDKGRAPTGGPPRRVRWVSIPMSIVMVGLGIVVVLGIPTIASFKLRAASPSLAFLRTEVEGHDALIIPIGEPFVAEDPAGDDGQGAPADGDILAADMTGLYEIPQWLLDDAFPCGSTGVACGDDGGGGPIVLEEGALLFVQRMAGAPPQAAGLRHGEWGPMVRVPGYVAAPALAGKRFEGSNHRFTTELNGDRLEIREYVYEDGAWKEYFTTARSAWLDDVLVTIVPLQNLAADPTAWDAFAFVRDASSIADDNVRPADNEVIEIERVPWIQVLDPRTVAP